LGDTVELLYFERDDLVLASVAEIDDGRYLRLFYPN